jgi:hypothetical protein
VWCFERPIVGREEESVDSKKSGVFPSPGSRMRIVFHIQSGGKVTITDHADRPVGSVCKVIHDYFAQIGGNVTNQRQLDIYDRKKPKPNAKVPNRVAIEE